MVPTESSSQLDTAERLTRLCGAGAPFRPLSQPRSPLARSGAGDLPLLQQGHKLPDEAVSIGKRSTYVKTKLHNLRKNYGVWPSTSPGRRKAPNPQATILFSVTCNCKTYFSSIISFSLVAESSSIFFVSLCVSLSSSSMARFFSSSLAFFSFSRCSIASFKSRRTLRTAVR